jgi:phage terminase large subunit-like protein
LNLADLSAKERLIVLLQEKARRVSGRKIDRFFPDTGPLRRELYPKHIAFFAAGKDERIRNAIAANRVGKTEGMGAYEMTCHLTGEYPKWWKGRRFATPVEALAAGDTSETVRDILQLKMVGPDGAFGTGMIPADPTGKWSRLRFRSYDQGREAFQGFELHVVWCDEEPPLEIFSELLTRTMTTDGIVFGTFTPLKGLTPLIKHCRDTGVFEIGVTWDDVPHLSKEVKADILRNTPEYLRKARSLGIPLMGSGLVFTVYEEDVMIDALPCGINIPKWWTCINGIDFGWDHPTAAAELWYDPEADIIYVTKVRRERLMTPVLFAHGVKNWNTAPWAWPHDGLQHDKGSGKQLAQLYIDAGLPMLADHAKFDDETFGVEAGVMEILERMQTGRFKVLRSLGEWWEEFRTYHREDGKIVKEMDDIICAVRYAVMCLRFAEGQKTGGYARPASRGPSSRARNPLNN